MSNFPAFCQSSLAPSITSSFLSSSSLYSPIAEFFSGTQPKRKPVDVSFQDKVSNKYQRISPPTLSPATGCKGKVNSDNRVHKGRLESVLDRPFAPWEEIDNLFVSLVPEWSHSQRGRMIHLLIHFLELKVGMEDEMGRLLLPMPLLDKAWRFLVLETQLYSQVTKTIQQFHQRPHQMIHYSLFVHHNPKHRQAHKKLCRTQSLFQIYFQERMPSTEDEIIGCSPQGIEVESAGTMATEEASWSSSDYDHNDDDDDSAHSSSLAGLNLI